MLSFNEKIVHIYFRSVEWRHRLCEWPVRFLALMIPVSASRFCPYHILYPVLSPTSYQSSFRSLSSSFSKSLLFISSCLILILFSTSTYLLLIVSLIPRPRSQPWRFAATRDSSIGLIISIDKKGFRFYFHLFFFLFFLVFLIFHVAYWKLLQIIYFNMNCYRFLVATSSVNNTAQIFEHYLHL